jgi:hypothetical protein
MRLNDERSTQQMATAVYGMIAGALTVLVIIAASLRVAQVMSPRTGDMIVFDPAKAVVMNGHAEVAALPVGATAATRCLLDPRIMQRFGGSFVVESATLRPGFSYRVHWAGTHTSTAPTDCGNSADLLLTADGLTLLSIAAGGWG